MQLNIEEVPTDVRRRAAQLLENIRGTDMDPTGGNASLSGDVMAIYRPDIKDIAYYEFHVDLGRGDTTQLAVSGDVEAEKQMQLPAKQGFVIAASSGHDHPVAHWSLDREPPSAQIAVAAEVNGAKVARIVKLDALCYAGESPDGDLAAQTGQLPMPIEGLPTDPAKGRDRITSTLRRPAAGAKDDSAPSKEPHETVQRGVRPRKVKIRAVDSWKELHSVYTETFGPLLQDLADQAAPAWEIEKLVSELGEGIMTGTSKTVALLEADAMVEVSGDGAKLVKLEPLKTAGKGGAVVVHVVDETLEQEVSFDLNISYRSGAREHLRFFAVSQSTRSGTKPASGLSIFEE